MAATAQNTNIQTGHKT